MRRRHRRFLEQQAYRLGISLEDFSRLALEHRGAAPRIAARCSVFAKSDLIHLQQKGVALPAMLYALCQSVARMVSSLNASAFDEPVYLTGGMSASPAIVQALEEAISEKNGHAVRISVPEDAAFTEAYGAALLSRQVKSNITFPLPALQRATVLPDAGFARADREPKRSNSRTHNLSSEGLSGSGHRLDQHQGRHPG